MKSTDQFLQVHNINPANTTQYGGTQTMRINFLSPAKNVPSIVPTTTANIPSAGGTSDHGQESLHYENEVKQFMQKN